jgi:purine catabolism regulator
MEITLRELLTANILQSAMPGVGASGLDNKVTSLCVIDSPTGYSYINDHELVITSGYFISLEDEESQVDLIERLVEKGAAGMILKTLYFSDRTIPRGIVERATVLGFPIIILPDYYASHRSLITFFDNNVYCHGTKSFMNKSELLGRFILCLKSGNLPGLARQLHQLTGLDVTILFDQKSFVSSSDSLSNGFPEQVCDFIRQKQLISSKGSPEFIEFYGNDGSDNNKGGLSETMRGLGTMFSFLPDMLGSIWLDCLERTPDENDRVLLKNSQLACTIEIEAILEFQQNQEKYRIRLIEDLLSGKSGAWSESVLTSTGYHLRMPLETQVLVIGGGESAEFCYGVELSVREFFKAHHEDIVTHTYRDSVVVLLPSQCFDKSGMLQELYASLVDQHQGYQPVLGFGRAVSLKDLSISYQQAKYAVQNGGLTNLALPIYDFKKLGYYRLGCAAAQPDELAHFCEDFIGPLIELNKTTNLDILNTLNVFFECHENYSRAGQALFLKPNAIRYRIKVIERTCGVDLENDFDLLNMKMALRLMHTVDSSIPGWPG